MSVLIETTLGDPTGTGKGGGSIWQKISGKTEHRFFKSECKLTGKGTGHSQIGTVGMASPSQNCNGSQFYFTLRPKLNYLDRKFTVFAVVSEGLEVITKLNDIVCDDSGRPFVDTRIRHTYVLDDPFPNPPNFPEKMPMSPRISRPLNETVRPRLTQSEVNNPHDGLTKKEIEEKVAKESAVASATVLEMLGDLPTREAAPDENILFVCKLNSVTDEDDLELIFSRFGTIHACDIIKDSMTGDSLQYAFIEFSSKEECEEAYLKMDNVIIDDRRIHVDFMQSVNKKKFRNPRQNLKKQVTTMRQAGNSKAEIASIPVGNSGRLLTRESDGRRSRSRDRDRHRRRSRSRDRDRYRRRSRSRDRDRYRRRSRSRDRDRYRRRSRSRDRDRRRRRSRSRDKYRRS